MKVPAGFGNAAALAILLAVTACETAPSGVDTDQEKPTALVPAERYPIAPANTELGRLRDGARS